MSIVTIKVVTFLFLTINLVNCANILVVSSVATHSHHIWIEAYSLGLVKSGHNVTMVTHDESKIKLNNFTTILLEGVYDQEPQDFEELANSNAFAIIIEVLKFYHNVCLRDVRTDGFQTLMSYPNDFKFDLIVWDLNAGHCMYPLITKFGDPPLIGLSPFGLQHQLSQMFGNQIPFQPFYLTEGTANKMTFFERLENHFYVNLLTWADRLIYLPAQTEAAKRIFTNINITSLETYERRFTLLLTNTDPVWGDAVPLTPNIIPVGGLHVKKPKKLPEDLQKFLDNATKGAVYVAFGSNVMPEKLTKLNEIIKALSKLPFKVLWKIDEKQLNVTLPANVIAKKWLPQNDILAHENVVLFISHGGSLSTQESLYHGVPLLIVPFFIDQLVNANRLFNRHVAMRVPYNKLNESNLLNAATEMLKDSSYRSNAQRISKLYKDRLNEPLDVAVYWTEYVLKYGYLNHLDVINRDMYFFETVHLDVILFILIALLLLVILIVTFLYCCCCNRKSKNDDNKIKKS